MNSEIYKSLTPVYPWCIAEVLEGVDLNGIHKEDFAEVGIDNKYQGKYMTICRILANPYTLERLNAEVGDLVCVWATAVEAFKILEHGSVSLIRNPDIFLRIEPGTILYNEVTLGK